MRILNGTSTRSAEAETLLGRYRNATRQRNVVGSPIMLSKTQGVAFLSWSTIEDLLRLFPSVTVLAGESWNRRVREVFVG